LQQLRTILSKTLAGHVGLREQWDQKTPDERATWIKEQRLALQCLGSNAVVKELTQFFSITQETADTTDEKEKNLVERDYLDEEDVIEKYKTKPGVAQKVFDNCPTYPKWQGVWMQC
jgi:hypothetical protein